MRLLAALILGLLATCPVTAAPPQAYKAARIWTGAGPVIADGILVVRDGKIVAVGPRGQVTVPDDAEVHDLGAAVLIPGLVVAETTLGERGRDDERALTPEFRALDGFDFYADFRTALSGGVTTVQIVPGTRRLLPGQGAVVKLAGDSPAQRVLRERGNLRVLLGDAYKNPPRLYEPPVGAVSVDRPLEPTRQQLGASLASAMSGLRATLRAAADYDLPTKGPRERDALLGAVAEQLQNGRQVRITAPAAADIRAALNLGREFNLRLVLVDPVALAPFRDQLGAWRDLVAGVVLNAEVRPGILTDAAAAEKDGAKRRLRWENARELLAAGIKTALRPASDDDLNDMLYLAGLFTSGGLSTEQALRMVTVDAAELLGVADRVGTLAAAKDADFVLLSGEPFALHSRVESVYVNGNLAYTSKKAAKATIIQAGQIYTGTGEAIAGGSLLVADAKIRGLGRNVSVPADAVVRRYEKAVVVPGFIDLGTGLGLGGPLNTSVGLQTRLGERLVSGDPAMAAARRGGVTTVLLASSNAAPGPVVAFKLGDQPRVVRDPVAIRFGISGNLTSQASTLRSTLQAAKLYADSWQRYDVAQADYEKKKAEFDAARPKSAPATKPTEGGKGEEKKAEASKGPAEPKPPEKPRVVESLEAYRPLFSGKIPALVDAQRADAIKLAVQIFRDEFKVRTVLLGAVDAFRMADLLAEKQVAVAVGPELVRTVDREPINLAQTLAVRGVPFAFQSRATSGVRLLPAAVQYAVHRGLGSDDGLSGLTASPARLLSIEDQVGTLAVGKAADLVVLSGPPFELSTRVLAVMIDGQWVYEAEGDR